MADVCVVQLHIGTCSVSCPRLDFLLRHELLTPGSERSICKEVLRCLTVRGQ